MNSMIKAAGWLMLSLSYLALSAQDSLQHSLLWKISGNQLKEPSYLFGTIHMIPTEDFFLPKGTEECLRNSNAVVMELDLSEAGDLDNMMPVMEKIFMEGDTTLADLLSPEDYMFVSESLDKLGLPMMFFERMKPMFLSAMASPEMNPTQLQDGSVKSYELEFASLAKKYKKKVKGLETVAFQISVFDSIPYAVQARMLIQAMKSADDSEGSLKKLVQLYKSQNLNLLQDAIQDDSDGLRPYMSVLLNNRNQNWIPVMKEMMSQGSCFFAVGAGHLAGESGVIQLLKKENFLVEPVPQI